MVGNDHDTTCMCDFQLCIEYATLTLETIPWLLALPIPLTALFLHAPALPVVFETIP